MGHHLMGHFSRTTPLLPASYLQPLPFEIVIDVILSYYIGHPSARSMYVKQCTSVLSLVYRTLELYSDFSITVRSTLTWYVLFCGAEFFFLPKIQSAVV
jgi:hypothetical protein